MSARADRLEKSVTGQGLDALVVTNLVNVRYLTGYTGSNGICVVGRTCVSSSPTSAT